jgi:hypothetical protein
MSWDVFLYSEDPRPYPKGTKPPPLGTEAEVLAILAEAFPDQEQINSLAAQCDVPGGILRFSPGVDDGQIFDILVEVSGGPPALAALMAFCRAHQWVAYQWSDKVLVDPAHPSTPSWEKYQLWRASQFEHQLDFCGQKWRPSRPAELTLFLGPDTGRKEHFSFCLQAQFVPLWLEDMDCHSLHRTFVLDMDGFIYDVPDYRQLPGTVVAGREAIWSQRQLVQEWRSAPHLSLWSMGPGGIHHHAQDGWNITLTFGDWAGTDYELNYEVLAFFPGERARAANDELCQLESACEDIADDDPRWAVLEEGWQFRHQGVLRLDQLSVTAPVNAADPIGWAKAIARRRLQLNDFGFCKVNGGDYDGSFKLTDGLGRNGRLVRLHPATSFYRRWLAQQKKS